MRVQVQICFYDINIDGTNCYFRECKYMYDDSCKLKLNRKMKSFQYLCDILYQFKRIMLEIVR